MEGYSVWSCVMCLLVAHQGDANSSPFVHTIAKKYLPYYHVTSSRGILNEPCAFLQYQGHYHVFYQYYIKGDKDKIMRWGHLSSNNLVDWQEMATALQPEEKYDHKGCYGGSALTYDRYVGLFYSGLTPSKKKSFYTQNLAMTLDGVTFQKYLHNPSVVSVKYGYDEFKNPHVVRSGPGWYMLVGSGLEQRGRLLLYTSGNMYDWRFNSTIAESYGDMGTVWESPEYFELDGLNFLLLSVRNIQFSKYRDWKPFQTGYVVGNFENYLFKDMEVSSATFKELDFGYDFYAPRTTLVPDGRRLLIAWIGTWKDNDTIPFESHTSSLTVVRELSVGPEGTLLMKPAAELKALRTDLVENGWYRPGEAFHAGARSFELLVTTKDQNTDAGLALRWGDADFFSVFYSSQRGSVEAHRSGTENPRKAYWAPKGNLQWRIFVDSSSVELFCGQGEVVFTMRIKPRMCMNIQVTGYASLHIQQYNLRRMHAAKLSKENSLSPVKVSTL